MVVAESISISVCGGEGGGGIIYTRQMKNTVSPPLHASTTANNITQLTIHLKMYINFGE